MTNLLAHSFIFPELPAVLKRKWIETEGRDVCLMLFSLYKHSRSMLKQLKKPLCVHLKYLSDPTQNTFYISTCYNKLLEQFLIARKIFSYCQRTFFRLLFATFPKSREETQYDIMKIINQVSTLEEFERYFPMIEPIKYNETNLGRLNDVQPKKKRKHRRKNYRLRQNFLWFIFLIFFFVLKISLLNLNFTRYFCNLFINRFFYFLFSFSPHAIYMLLFFNLYFIGQNIFFVFIFHIIVISLCISLILRLHLDFIFYQINLGNIFTSYIYFVNRNPFIKINYTIISFSYPLDVNSSLFERIIYILNLGLDLGFYNRMN